MSNIVAPNRKAVTGDNWDLHGSVLNQKGRHRNLTGLHLLDVVPKSVRYALVAVIALFTLMAVDGVRRETAELSTSVQSFQGDVSVLKAAGYTVSPIAGMQIRERDAILTGVDGTAVLVFPDGSAVQVEPSTKFIIRRLDLARGGVRERSFMLCFGSAVLQVSKFFGAKSEARICTPTAVAAARGTGFRVRYDLDKDVTTLEVGHGKVEFTSGVGTVFCGAGRGGVVEDGTLGKIYRLPAKRMSELSSVLNKLAKCKKQTGMLQGVEWGLLRAADPVLETANITPGNRGRAYSDSDRVAKCNKALREVSQCIRKMRRSTPPRQVNLVTLDVLNLKQKDRARIMGAFAGEMLAEYQVIDDTQFQVSAHARDRKRTLVRVIGTMRDIYTARGFVHSVAAPPKAHSANTANVVKAIKFGGFGVRPMRRSKTPMADEAFVAGLGESASETAHPIELIAGYVESTGESETPVAVGGGSTSVAVEAPFEGDAATLPADMIVSPAVAELIVPPSTLLVPAEIASFARGGEVFSGPRLGLGAVGAALMTAAAESALKDPLYPAPVPVPEPGALGALAIGAAYLGARKHIRRAG